MNSRDKPDFELFNLIAQTTGKSFDDCMDLYHDFIGYHNLLVVDRFTGSDTTTISRISFNGEFVCHGLEDEYRSEKAWGKTRIPAGIYPVKLRKEGGFDSRYRKRFPAFHEGMLELQNVPNFKYILFHVGNDHEDTAGCILTGRWNQRSMFVSSSAATYERFYNTVVEAAKEGSLLVFVQDNDR